VAHLEYLINTSIPVIFESIDNMPYIDSERFETVKIWIAHTGLNRNNSVFSKELLESMIPSLVGIPILGYIEADSDEQEDFTGHEQRLVIKKGNIDIVYVGKAFGVILANNNAKFETKIVDDVEREYLTCEGILWKKFKDCIEIFNRDGVKPHSMELFPPSIKGTFSKDRHFHFESAKFDGLCILGDDVTPAMIGGSIEKFAISSFSDEVADLLNEIKSTMDKFSECSKSTFINNETGNEGGSEMDEKISVLEKYGYTIETIDFSVEDMTVEEIEEKMKTFSAKDEEAKVEKPATDFEEETTEVVDETPETEFAMSANTLRQEVYKALSTRKVILKSSWDNEPYETNEFYMIDIKDSYAIVEGNDWNVYGIPFTVKGDFVELDFDGKVEFVSEWRQKVGEETSEFATIHTSRFAEFENSMKERIEKFNETIATLQSEKDSVTAEFTSLKETVSELSEYKNAKEEAEKKVLVDSLFESYSSLDGVAEYEEIKTMRDTLSVDEMETKIALCYARKNVNFTTSGKLPEKVKVKIQTSDEDDDRPYGGIMEKYLNI
jgi:hypothetical protein